jgi:4-hydroxythreonine-4-phosphate dehydrogenase
MKSELIRVGITHGDINGIGYEVILKTLLDPRIYEICTPIIYGSPKIAAYHRKALNLGSFNLNAVNSVEEVTEKKPNIINVLDDNIRVELGKATSISGESALKSLEKATEDLKAGKFDVLVTAPINKEVIQSEGFQFPGHTEYLEKKFSSESKSLMLMVGEDLKVGVITGHISLRDVPQNITKENIINKLRILNKCLMEDFGIDKPKIAVIALNPHAGDNGLLGKEENEIIIPALEQLRNSENILALGPYAADGFFGSNSKFKFDAIIAMYHDQGLIPFKALEFDNGINFTAGLSIVRTSPAHGTAFELAGLNQASPNSFRQAIYHACDIYKKRLEYKELIVNPLQHYEVT